MPLSTDNFVYRKDLTKWINKEYKQILSKAKTGVFTLSPSKFLADKEILEKLFKFTSKHLQDFRNEISDGEFDWNNEHSKLFFQLMRDKYKISNRDLAFSLLYIYHESEYHKFNDDINNYKVPDAESFFKQAVLADIKLNNSKKTDDFFLNRALKERNISIGLLKTTPGLYKKVKNKIQLNQFENDLDNEKERINKSIDQRIKHLTNLEFFKEAERFDLDSDEKNYLIAGIDHSRSSRIDSKYRRDFKLTLFKAFKTECVKCNEYSMELELDHFWMPKSKGGNFVMRHKEDGYVNNCIPLCRSCNASKGAKHFLDFFSLEELDRILPISQSLNSEINAAMKDFKDEDFEEDAA